MCHVLQHQASLGAPFLNCVSMFYSAEQQLGQDVGSAKHLGGLATGWEASSCPSCLLQCALPNMSFAMAPRCRVHTSVQTRAVCFLKTSCSCLTFTTLISPPASFQEVFNYYFPAHRHTQLAQQSLMVGASGRKMVCVWLRWLHHPGRTSFPSESHSAGLLRPPRWHIPTSPMSMLSPGRVGKEVCLLPEKACSWRESWDPPVHHLLLPEPLQVACLL